MRSVYPRPPQHLNWGTLVAPGGRAVTNHPWTSAGFSQDQTVANGRVTPGWFGRIFLPAIMRWSIVVNVVFSMSTFNEAIVPASYTTVQQVFSLLMWMIVIAGSCLVQPVVRLKAGTDTIVLSLFYGFTILSFLWSADPAVSALKSVALLITTIGAYCLITRISIDDIVSASAKGLFLLSAASIFYVVFIPEIGVDHSWMHDGQWQGVYESKQSLGVVAAFLIFFAFYQKLSGRSGWLIFMVVFSTAIACAIGSESRGGGALSLAACAILYLSQRSIPWMKIFSYGPIVMTAGAAILIVYLYLTGYDYLPLFGVKVDFTERTFIWQYAIGHIDDAPFFGFGINGFWTIKRIYDVYEQNHGWVLDNYHNGYIGIVVETGIVGFLLFSLSTTLFTVRVFDVIANRSIPRLHCAMIVAFAALNYQINFTEWTFLRSTTYTSVLMIAFMLGLCRASADQEQRG